MSFTNLKVDELRKVADDFGVDIKPKATKDNIIEALSEMEVTFEMYDSFRKASGVQHEVIETAVDKGVETTPNKSNERSVLVKMERENGTYETYGYRFTKANPFVVVKESDADKICRNEEGFRLALPSEVSEYYG